MTPLTILSIIMEHQKTRRNMTKKKHTLLEQLLGETREAYLKRLNDTVFRCSVCNEVFLNEMMAEPNTLICKDCDQSGRVDKFYGTGRN